MSPRLLCLIAATFVSGCAGVQIINPFLEHRFADWREKRLIDNAAGFEGTRRVRLRNGEEVGIYDNSDGTEVVYIECGKRPRRRSNPKPELGNDAGARYNEVEHHKRLMEYFSLCEWEARRICKVKTRSDASTFALLGITQIFSHRGARTNLAVKCMTSQEFEEWSAGRPRTMKAADLWRQVLERQGF